MRIAIYSDAAETRNGWVAACVVLTDDLYLGTVTRKYGNLLSVEAEMQGILEGLRFVRDNKLQYDSIDVYCDCATAIKELSSCILNKTVSIRNNYPYICKELTSIVYGKNVHAHYLQGHINTGMNTITTCHTLCKRVRSEY